MMRRSLQALLLAGSVLVLLAARTPPGSTSFPPGTPSGLLMADSALGALLDEVTAEHVSAHLMNQLDGQITHARQQLVKAAGFAVANNHKQAKAAVGHARRWLISFTHLVGSRGGRKGGADRAKLVPMAQAILKELQTLRGSV